LATEIIRVLGPTERQIFEPLIENYNRAKAALFACAAAFEPRFAMKEQGIAFEPETFAYTRELPEGEG
jgi:hypothetical protein